MRRLFPVSVIDKRIIFPESEKRCKAKWSIQKNPRQAIGVMTRANTALGIERLERRYILFRMKPDATHANLSNERSIRAVQSEFSE